MTDITRLSQFVNGVLRGVDLTTNNLVTSTVTVGGVGGTTLSKAILDNLVNLQNGTDFSTGTNSHTHDGRYYTQTQLNAYAGATTSGAYDIGVFHTAVNYTAAGATVEQHIAGIDTAIGAAGSAITSLTGDVTASGPGAAAATVAKIQGTTVSGTTGTGNVVFSASPTLTGTIAGASQTLSGTLVATGAISGSNLTSGGHASLDLALSGGTMSGNIAMGGNLITGLGAPVANGQALRFDQLGANSGIATLDSGGKIPLSQLPASLMEYQGTWDASTNTPTLADGTGVSGYFYRVQVAGTQNLGSGSQTFVVGDWVMYNGTIWQLAHAGADAVISVNGSAGTVTVNAINQLTGDVTAGPASQSQSKAATVAAIQGTTVSGTTGTGNVMFSASPTTTGTLTAAAISASGTITGSNLSGTNTGDQTITLTGDVTGSGTGSFATAIGAAKVSATQLATGAFDQKTITGGAGTAAAVAYAPAVEITAVYGGAATLAANTTYALRWGSVVNGETQNKLYLADWNTASHDLFWAVGLYNSGSTTSTGATITITNRGTLTLGSSDTNFGTSGSPSNDVGLPVWLGASGAYSANSTSSPTTGDASMKLGIAQAYNQIWVDLQMMGVN